MPIINKVCSLPLQVMCHIVVPALGSFICKLQNLPE